MALCQKYSSTNTSWAYSTFRSLMCCSLQVMELMVFSWARSSTHPLSCLESSTQQLCPEQAVEVRGCGKHRLRLNQSLVALHQCQLRCIRGDLALWLIQIARWVGHVAHPFLSSCSALCVCRCVGVKGGQRKSKGRERERDTVIT